jgi:Uma2 family endonuclease
MASLPNPRTITYEEWLRMPEVQDATEEVVNGEIRITPPDKWLHAIVSSRVAAALDGQLDYGSYYVFSSSFGLVIRENPLTCRQPDLAVFHRATMIEKDGFIRSAPQLAVEVLSPSKSRREREEKLGDYASIGVPEVWVVSPEARTVEVLCLRDGYLRTAQILSQGVLEPASLPQVQLPIADIWPD